MNRLTRRLIPVYLLPVVACLGLFASSLYAEQQLTEKESVFLAYSDSDVLTDMLELNDLLDALNRGENTTITLTNGLRISNKLLTDKRRESELYFEDPGNFNIKVFVLKIKYLFYLLENIDSETARGLTSPENGEALFYLLHKLEIGNNCGDSGDQETDGFWSWLRRFFTGGGSGGNCYGQCQGSCPSPECNCSGYDPNDPTSFGTCTGGDSTGGWFGFKFQF